MANGPVNWPPPPPSVPPDHVSALVIVPAPPRVPPESSTELGLMLKALATVSDPAFTFTVPTTPVPAPINVAAAPLTTRVLVLSTEAVRVVNDPPRKSSVELEVTWKAPDAPDPPAPPPRTSVPPLMLAVPVLWNAGPMVVRPVPVFVNVPLLFRVAVAAASTSKAPPTLSVNVPVLLRVRPAAPVDETTWSLPPFHVVVPLRVAVCGVPKLWSAAPVIDSVAAAFTTVFPPSPAAPIWPPLQLS